jgi:hypothetical protein
LETPQFDQTDSIGTGDRLDHRLVISATVRGGELLEAEAPPTHALGIVADGLDTAVVPDPSPQRVGFEWLARLNRMASREPEADLGAWYETDLDE